MSAKIDILITGITSDCQNAIEFFGDSEWNDLTEAKITKALREIFTLVRPLSKSLKINLTISTDDPERLKMVIGRNISRPSTSIHEKLSFREVEVFNLIVQGYTNNEIAEKLFICFETVRSHRKNILKKTKCSNTAKLIDYFHNVFFDNKEDLH